LATGLAKAAEGAASAVTSELDVPQGVPSNPDRSIPSTVDPSVAQKPLTGILLAAAQSQQLDPILWTWVTIPGKDLEVQVPTDAFRTTLAGVDHIRIGVTYGELRQICKLLDCIPPSQAIVDAIYNAAAVRPMPSLMSNTAADVAAMNTIGMELRYNAKLEASIAALAKAKKLKQFPPTALVESVGKWWIIHPHLAQSNKGDKAACTYGWFQGDVRKPVQGPSLDAHNDDHCDYSQVGRGVKRMARVASTKDDIDLCDVYVKEWPQLARFVDVFRA
jgi:hypothetical protein